MDTGCTFPPLLRQGDALDHTRLADVSHFAHCTAIFLLVR